MLVNGLHLQGASLRPVSPGLLNAFPLVDPITPVAIDGAGEPSPALGPDYPVGSIVKTVDSRGEQLYVVLRDGLQPVSPATADIIRYGDPDAAGPSARDIAPAIVAGCADRASAAGGPLPDGVAADRAAPTRTGWLCMGWQRSNTAAQATVRLLVGHRLPVPGGAQPVRLATADGNGPGVGLRVPDTGSR